MKHTKALNLSGDTVIEVLAVLAVLGLAFVTAYSISIKSLGQARNAQEHSEALGDIRTQTEWLRTAAAQRIVILPVNTPFCMTSPTTIAINFLSGNGVMGSAQATPADFLDKYPAACKTSNERYGSSIIFSGNSIGASDVKVRWDGVGSLGIQQEQINYRTY